MLAKEKSLEKIRCKTSMSKEVVSRGINVEIKLTENSWLCYKLHYDIAVPWPTDDIEITINGIKKNGESLLIPSISYKEGEHTRLSF